MAPGCESAHNSKAQDGCSSVEGTPPTCSLQDSHKQVSHPLRALTAGASPGVAQGQQPLTGGQRLGATPYRTPSFGFGDEVS